jgi:hypothetical protein
MTEQQFTDEYEAAEADAAEQSLPVVRSEEERQSADERAPLPLEVDAADAAEQAAVVPVDEDEYR